METDAERVQRYKEAAIKLSAALSRIDYLCGPPNDMEVSNYDIHCDESVVIEAVKLVIKDRDCYLTYNEYLLKEISRYRKAIEDAPHAHDCQALMGCGCWKATALNSPSPNY